ncbi:MAG: trehalose-6-phosphate synthase [Oligoflexia bacterium]|nr:trehalose-6-phosphate synthase [Oligoflexia bacterium]
MKRYYLLWLYAVLIIATLVAGIESGLEQRRSLRIAREHLASLSAGIEDSVTQHYHAKRPDRIARAAERLKRRPGISSAFESLVVCAYNRAGAWLQEKTFAYPAGRRAESLCLERGARQAVAEAGTAPEARTGAAHDSSWRITRAGRTLQLHATPLPARAGANALVLVISQDLGPLRQHWLQQFLRTFLISAVLGVGLLILVGAHLRSWLRSHLSSLHQTLRSLIAGRKLPQISPDLQPLSAEIAILAEKLRRRSAPAAPPSLADTIGKRKLVIVANREPYIHQKDAQTGAIRVIRPASGLVSALEPLLRQSGGLWVAHGSGTADAETSGPDGELAVPPERPRYTLRRIWLSEAEEKGYYYGFSNEGLWPLCHLAHTRPIFRLGDWNDYREVNARFAAAVPAQALASGSLILVQDYHFALVPRMLKHRAGERPPRVALFWHIPWPNPEAFGICPWGKELLEGMLGADVIGFHTQYHCNNFLESCNRYLEARIDLERFSVTRDNHETLVRAFPIGIDTPPVPVLYPEDRARLKKRYGATAELLAIGVDRIDYTKGLIERIEAVERFLEKNPDYVGRFSLLQVGAPSRSSIPAYRQFLSELESSVKRVNARFGSAEGYRPVIFEARHHEWDEVQELYQLGDVCLVTSLHDGMNLVAKEYVWCQQPERGSLILSKFTGASRELTEAFLVNPYSIEEMADSLAAALQLPPAEKARRMSAMKEKVRTRNAYAWASDLIHALIATEEPAAPATERPTFAESLQSGTLRG